MVGELLIPYHTGNSPTNTYLSYQCRGRLRGRGETLWFKGHQPQKYSQVNGVVGWWQLKGALVSFKFKLVFAVHEYIHAQSTSEFLDLDLRAAYQHISTPEIADGTLQPYFPFKLQALTWCAVSHDHPRGFVQFVPITFLEQSFLYHLDQSCLFVWVQDAV